MARLLPDGTKQLSLTKEQFAEINSVLRAVFQKTKCSTIFFADASGLLIARHGTMETNNLSGLSALSAANHAATAEMAKLIGEKLGFKNNFYEGEVTNLYVTGVSESYFLVVAFSKTTTFGMVRLLTDKAVEQLAEIVSRVAEPTQTEKEDPGMQQNMDDEDFRDELSSRLNDVLFSNS